MKKKNNTEEFRLTQDPDAVAEYNGETSNSAKYVEATGDDHVEEFGVLDTSFKARAENIWYHYKWSIIIGAFIIILLAVGIPQIVNGEKHDLSALYSGRAVIAGEEYDEVEKTLSELLTTDFDGNGETNVFLYALNYYGVKDGVESPTAGDIFIENDRRELESEFNELVFAGECGVMFLDKALFERVRESGGLVTLEDALGYTPEGAIDKYGVRLGDTAAYVYYPSLKVMPADTVVCLRGISTVGGVFTPKKTAEKVFEKNKAMFCDYFAFEYPEGFVPEDE